MGLNERFRKIEMRKAREAERERTATEKRFKRDGEMIKATIITIGDEILIGQIVDTNSASIAKRLNEAGISVDERISVGDDAERIAATVRGALDRTQVVILTGGLGPRRTT